MRGKVAEHPRGGSLLTRRSHFTLPSKNAKKVDQLDVAPESEKHYTIVRTFAGLELDPEGLYSIPWGEGTCSGFRERISICYQD